jgi:hypothetical protein
MQPQKPFSESGTSPPRHVTLTRVQITPGCTVALGEGLDECGRAVSFAGDWRPMVMMAEELRAGRRVEVWLVGSDIISYDSDWSS